MRLISKRKIKALAERIVQNGAEAALFVNDEPMQDMNIPYLSGFFGMLDGALIFDADSKLTLITTGLDYERAVEQSNVDEILKTTSSKPIEEIAKRVLKGRKKIGVVKSSLTLDICKRLGIPISRFVDIGSAMREERAVKEESEIEAIKKSASICNGGIRFLQDSIKKGVKENEVSSELEKELKALGSERSPFDIIVTSGPKSSFIHPYPSAGSKRLDNGLGIVDFGAVHKGYSTDVTVPFIVGTPSKKESSIIKAVLYSYDLILKRIREGATTRSMNFAYEKSVKSVGFQIKHSLGHGIGLEIHDAPTLCFNQKLKQNMVLAIEPGIYVKGVGGCRLENDVIVNKGGCTVITKSKLIST